MPGVLAPLAQVVSLDVFFHFMPRTRDVPVLCDFVNCSFDSLVSLSSVIMTGLDHPVSG